MRKTVNADLRKSEDEPLLPDLFGQTQVPPVVRRLVKSAADIQQDVPDRADFLHTVLCQVGMPRREQSVRTFERTSGAVSMVLEAGRLWTSKGWKDQPLPHGTRPRLVMVHISTEAVRTRTREIEIGSSIREFMLMLGLDPGGREHAHFKRQMEALAACRMTIGMASGGRAVTINTNPIQKFEAWLHPTGDQRVLWPGSLSLSQEFFDTLNEHAVPLDYRALAALKHSALALDVYTWLAHRLCRVRPVGGAKVSWDNLRGQFGQEYADPKNFKKEFRQALRQVLAVYPDARLEDVVGGFMLYPSPPPLPKSQVTVKK